MDRPSDPVVSVVIPARNEADYLQQCLESVRALETERAYEVLVVDGASDDETPAIAAAMGATVVEESGSSIAAGRNRGADRARGEWLAFVDADTMLRPTYIDELLRFTGSEGLVAASSRCRMDGARATLMEATINHVFPRLDRPILPGFNFFVDRAVFEATGGFPDVPNEDTAYSRALGRRYATGYHPDVLVETSSRRIADVGLTGTLYHYVRLDLQRLRAAN